MKLAKEHIGKKMKLLGVRSSFFIPLAQTSKGDWLGENDQGEFEGYGNYGEYWEFYEDPEWDLGTYGTIISEDLEVFQFAKETSMLFVKVKDWKVRIVGIEHN